MPTNVEQIIMAAAIDAMIEDELKKNLSEESFPELNLLVAVCRPDLLLKEREELLNNLIGKKYVPQDNSYIREIINGKKMNYHCSLIGVPCQIISRPYITEVHTFAKDKRERMIKVKSLRTGLIYEVMFAESWICD